MIGAIILSGGKSERMGSPKALLEYRGQTFLARILAAIATAGIDCRIVVAGHHHAQIVQTFPDVSVVFNPEYERGMSTSVQAGVRALPRHLDGAAIFLVDHPLIDAATIDALANRLLPGHIIAPVHEGRRGHPVVFAADLFGEILDLAPDQGLNTVVRRKRDRVVEVFVENAGILRDIDTPEQFSKLIGGDP
jgi:CTP:molybdopterin cytidylyltransferase MocA